MRLRRVLGPSVSALAAALALAGGAGAQGGPAAVTVDRGHTSARLGGDFSFRTTIANPSASETSALIAHLNILSLRGGVYVDPEDWSTQRTWYLGTLSAHESRTITWKLKAVGSGRFAAYVAVLPQANPSEPPATSPTIQIEVAERRTLNSGGVLPLALGVPGLVGLVAGGVRIARRRR